LPGRTIVGGRWVRGGSRAAAVFREFWINTMLLFVRSRASYEKSAPTPSGPERP
jgi:hypothetical protein